MFGITDPATYLIGTIFIVLLPGPNSLYVLSVAASRGIRAGYQGALGVFVGDAVLMTLAATGMAAVLKAYPVLFWGLKYVGAGYLAWRSCRLTARPPCGLVSCTAPSRSAWRSKKSGVWIRNWAMSSSVMGWVCMVVLPAFRPGWKESRAAQCCPRTRWWRGRS